MTMRVNQLKKINQKLLAADETLYGNGELNKIQKLMKTPEDQIIKEKRIKVQNIKEEEVPKPYFNVKVS